MLTRAKNESVIGMYGKEQPPTNDQGKVYDKKSFGFGSFNLCVEANCSTGKIT